MIKARLLVLCWCLLFMGTRAYEKRQSGGARHYCGARLTNTLSLICDGIYKRSRVEEPSDNHLESPEWISPKSAALSMTRQHQFRARHTRGVVSECCHKACTVSELASYCGVRDR